MMKEELLLYDDYPLYQYHKQMRSKRFPLFVLNYIGGRGAEIKNPEIVWGLGDIEQQLQLLKAKVIRERSGNL